MDYFFSFISKHRVSHQNFESWIQWVRLALWLRAEPTVRPRYKQKIRLRKETWSFLSITTLDQTPHLRLQARPHAPYPSGIFHYPRLRRCSLNSTKTILYVSGKTSYRAGSVWKLYRQRSSPGPTQEVYSRTIHQLTGQFSSLGPTLQDIYSRSILDKTYQRPWNNSMGCPHHV